MEVSVTGLRVAPVKSTALHDLDEARVERFGAALNRRFYIARPDGRLFNNSGHGPLVRIRAEYDPHDERLALRFPDGTVVEGDATAVGPAVTTDFFGRPATGHVLEGRWSAALSAYAGRPLVLVRPDGPGDANDAAPVSIHSRASAGELDRQMGMRSPLDPRRWRMLVEVDGLPPHGEDEWVGRRVSLGEVVVDVLRPVARCVITTQDPQTGLRDADTLRGLRSYRRNTRGRALFGVYASVVEPGTVRLGDPVRVLEDARASASPPAPAQPS